MIAAVAFCAMWGSFAPTLSVIEVETKGDAFTLCATVRAPENLSASEQASWHVLALAMREGNQEFTASTIWSQCDEFTVAASDRLLTVQLSGPQERLSTMSRILRAVLTKPLIDEDLRKRLIASLNAPLEEDLMAVLRWRKGDTESARANAIASLYTRVIRPENLSIAVSASRTANLNAATVLRAFEGWTPRPARADYGSGRMQGFAGPGMSAPLLLAGAPMMPTTNHAGKVLAVFALGVGKESTMHRVLRDQAALSYRQEAMLWATPEGWRPCLLIAGEEPVESAGVLKLMEKDVETYSESHLHRAAAMATACLTRGSSASPIWVGAARPYLASESDRVMWASYWGLLGMGNLTPEGLVQDLGKVKLDELKADAKELLGQMMEAGR